MRFIIHSVVVCLAILSSASQAFASEKVKLALNWKPEPQFGGFYAAQVGGFDKKNGVELEILPGGAGTPVVQMVAAGQMSFGIASADEVVIARSRGADVVAVFAAYQTNPQAIMAHEERGFKSLSDLYAAEGTLAIQKGLPYAMFLEKKFAAAKIATKAKIVPYLGGIQNFLTDAKYSQQCFATSEPLAAAKQKVKTKTFLVADEGYNPYTTVLIVRGDVLKKNEALVKSVVASVRAGWREYLDHPEATNKKMGELNKSMDADTFKQSAEAQKYLIETAETKKDGLGSMTAARWTALSTQLVDLKQIKKPAEVSSHFRNL
jgi:NitT/TauT family transport system substrate-binding protein